MTDQNSNTSENKSTVCLITIFQEYTLLVFKDCHGYQVDVISPNGDRYCLGDIFYSAASAEAKGREWIEDLREEEDEFGLDLDE